VEIFIAIHLKAPNIKFDLPNPDKPCDTAVFRHYAANYQRRFGFFWSSFTPQRATDR
jgi:hypothetical protein